MYLNILNVMCSHVLLNIYNIKITNMLAVIFMGLLICDGVQSYLFSQAYINEL